MLRRYWGFLGQPCGEREFVGDWDMPESVVLSDSLTIKSMNMFVIKGAIHGRKPWRKRRENR